MRHATLSLAAAGLAVLTLSVQPARAQCDAFTFTPTTHPTGSNPGSIAFGDVDGDQLVDMVVSDAWDETLAVLLGTGGGAFAPAVLVPAGRAPWSVALGDLDGDGDLDAAVCTKGYLDAAGWHDYGLRVFWNTAGVFSLANSMLSPLPVGEIQPSDVALGDLDGDGDLDAVLPLHGTGNLHSKVASLLNDGTGRFGAAALAGTGFDPVSLVLGDLDGDGALDAVTANSLGDSVSVLHGHGDGTFTIGYSHSTGPYAQDVALGDFDGDGHPDGAVAYRYGVHVLRTVAGDFTWVATLSAGFFPSAVVFADLDGDGDLDLVATDGLGDQMFVWLGDGTGSFTPKSQSPIGDGPVAIVAADVDGDGDPDLAVALANAGTVNVLRNDCPLATYCVAKPNSLGCTPAIGSTGTPSLGGSDDFHLLATGELNHKPGVVFFGHQAAAIPFAGGTLCVHPPLIRTPVQDSGGNVGTLDCSGAYDFHVSNAWLAAHGGAAGVEFFTQYWSRDPQHPDGSGVALSDGLRFTVQP